MGIKRSVYAVAFVLLAGSGHAEDLRAQYLTPKGPDSWCGDKTRFASTLWSADALSKLSPIQLHLLRNEVFAHHCYQFREKYLQAYSTYLLGYDGGLARYWPREPDVKLNATEERNISLIRAAERAAKTAAKKEARAIELGFEADLPEGKEECFLLPPGGYKKPVMCFFIYPTSEGGLAFWGLDWRYQGLNSDSGVLGRPKHWKFIAADEFELSGVGRFKISGKKAVLVSGGP